MKHGRPRDLQDARRNFLRLLGSGRGVSGVVGSPRGAKSGGQKLATVAVREPGETGDRAMSPETHRRLTLGTK